MDMYIFITICIFSVILAVIGLAKVPLASIFSLVMSITVVLNEVLTNASLDGGLMTFGIVTILIGAISLFRRSG